jgi:hypothetical protein
MAISLLILLAALICFGLAAFGVASRVDLTALGLAFLTIAMLLGTGVLQ